MSKAILVMDMPKCCKLCKLSQFAKERHTGELCFRCSIEPLLMITAKESNLKPEWCPLKEVPNTIHIGLKPDDYKKGFHDCCEYILGEDK